MGLLKYNGKLVKSDGKLLKTLLGENQNPTEEISGLYDDDGNLVKTLDELGAERSETAE